MKKVTYLKKMLSIQGISLILAVIGLSCATTIPYTTGTKSSQTGITSLENIKINDLKHAVLIRGKDTSNPILLHIHGMGVPSMCFAFDEYLNDSVKENTFLVVHYDQRGFGKTYRYGKHGAKYITIKQYVDDAEALVSYLMQRFHKEKIYILAESWGTVIGAELVARHPDWFYAYIAVPQAANISEYLSNAYDFALEASKKDSNFKAMDELYKCGKPQPSYSKLKLNKAMGITGKWMDYYNLKRYNCEDMTGYFFWCLWKSPEYSMFDFTETLNGYKTTSEILNKRLISFDLITEVSEIKVPFYLIIGEYDLFVESSKKYFDAVKADKKYFLPITKAGHMVRGEQVEAFNRIIYGTILPETLK